MTQTAFDKENSDIAWCPGCGNYSILDAIKQAVAKLGITPQNLVVACGIGQAPKTPHYFNTNMFNGLHGRALPAATGIKASNPSLTVIAEGGDGDMYGEGGNHFIHTVRRNPDITHIVHDNMVYGLTKGQASPTTREGTMTPLQAYGVFEKPLNPMGLAIAMGAPFVARALSGDIEKTKELMKAAILHKGFALVDILQPCPSFNKINTMKWFRENSYYLEAGYDPTDRAGAFARALEEGPYPLGVLYRDDTRTSFEENQALYKRDPRPLRDRAVSLDQVRDIMEAMIVS